MVCYVRPKFCVGDVAYTTFTISYYRGSGRVSCGVGTLCKVVDVLPQDEWGDRVTPRYLFDLDGHGHRLLLDEQHVTSAPPSRY